MSPLLTEQYAPEDTDRQSQVGPTGGGGGKMAPEGVGESIAHRGENMIAEEGTEPGRYDLGTHGPTNRPVGGSTARDSTGVDPEDPSSTHRRRPGVSLPA